MRINPTILLATTAALALSACKTSLQSVQDVPSKADPNNAIRGATYSLPMLTFDITVTRSLAGCGNKIRLPPIDANGEETDGEVLDLWVGGPQIAIAATAKSEMIPGKRFRYDPAKLTGPSKTTNFQMTYQKDSDLLKGINSTTEDQTGPIIGDVVKVGLAVAGVALGPGTAAGAGLAAASAAATIEALPVAQPAIASDGGEGNPHASFDFTKLKNPLNTQTTRQKKLIELVKLISNSSQKKYMVICTNDTQSTIDTLNEAKNEKKNQADIAASLVRDIEKIVDVAKVVKPSEDDISLFKDQLPKLITALAESEKQQKIIDEANNKLNFEKSARWPQDEDNKNTNHENYLKQLDANYEDFQSILTNTENQKPIIVLDSKDFANKLSQRPDLIKEFPDWASTYVFPDGTSRFTKATNNNSDGACADTKSNVSVEKCLKTLLPVAVSLQAAAGHGDPVCSGPLESCSAAHSEITQKTNGPKPAEGLFYRIPAHGTLKLCRATVDTTQKPLDSCVGSSNIINEAVMIPQIGRLQFLPLKNLVFENNGLVANFDENGMLTDVKFVTSKAAGAGLASAAAGIAKDIKEFDDTRRKERKDDKEAKDKEAKAEAAEAKAKKEEADTATRTANENLAKDARADADLADAKRLRIIALRCLAIIDANPDAPAKCPAD